MSRHVVVGYTATKTGRDAVAFAARLARATGADAVAIDNSVDAVWAAAHVQKDGCVQGNLDPRHMVTGGAELVSETRRIVEAFRGGPHIFNLGHGITPDADPDNVALMLETLREAR